MVKRYFSLSIQISTLFMVLVSLIGITLISISYYHSRQLMGNIADNISHENSTKVEVAFQQSITPILTTLDFMALSHFIEMEQLPTENSHFLASLRLVFERNDNLVALYFGNHKGDFTMIRPLFNPQTRLRFQAPDQARLFINQTKMDGRDIVIFLDENFLTVGRQEHGNNIFDPRERPWYQNAHEDGQIRLTEPYFFHFLQTFGVTLSRRSRDNSTVVGADFTLDSLSQQLATIAYSANTQLALFDQQFRLLAEHNSPLSLTDDALITNQKLSTSVFAGVAQRVTQQAIFSDVAFSGQTWSVTLIPIALSPHVQLSLAQATPPKGTSCRFAQYA